MMKTFTLLLLACTLHPLVWAQSADPDFLAGDLPLDARFIAQNRVKSVRIVQESPGQRSAPTQIRLDYNPNGQMVQRLKLREADTALFQTFRYSKDGLLAWEITVDNDWNRVTKSDYRFNGDSTLFQIKSYEMLRTEVMLVGSQQFIYQGSTQPAVVRYYDGVSLLKTVKYAYDEAGRKVREQVFSPDGKLTESIAFIYDEAHRLTRVVRTAQRVSETVIAYNAAGRIERVESWESGKLQEWVDYEYNGEGFLSKINHHTSPDVASRPVSQTVEFSQF